MNDDDDIPSLDGANAFDPNAAKMNEALVPPEMKELSREKLERKLKARLGIEPDELKTLYPNDKDLFKFYNTIVLKMDKLEGNLDETKTKKDDYKLSKREKLEIENLELLQRRKERRRDEAEVKRKKAAKEAAKSAAKQPHGAPKTDQEPSCEQAAPSAASRVEQKAAFEAAGAHLPKEDQVSFKEAQEAMRDLLGKRNSTKSKKK